MLACVQLSFATAVNVLIDFQTQIGIGVAVEGAIADAIAYAFIATFVWV